MAIEDYATLSAATQSFMLDRTDLSAPMDILVMLGEQAIFHGLEGMEPLRCPEMETLANLTTVSGVAALPDNFLQWRAVTETSSPRRELEFIAGASANQMYPSGGSGLANHFSIVGTSVGTYPSTSNGLELIYYAMPTPLDPLDGTSSNAILIKYPSIYLRATCAMASEWMKQDAEMQKQFAMLRSSINAVNKQAQMMVMAKTGISFRRQVR
jgi:hypothetical protein